MLLAKWRMMGFLRLQILLLKTFVCVDQAWMKLWGRSYPTMSWVTFSPHFVLVSSYHPVESLFINFLGSFYPQKIKVVLLVVYITYVQVYFVIKFLVALIFRKLPTEKTSLITITINIYIYIYIII